MKTFKHVESFREGKDVQTLVKVETTEEMRVYHFDKLSFPSVTTVVGHEKKKHFEDWSKDPKNQKRKEQGAARGNAIHDSIEMLLNNNSNWCKNLTMQHRSVVGTMMTNLNRIDNVHCLEEPLISSKLQLAGRVDCIAEFDDKLSVIDFKGAFFPRKREWIENYFMQATAYAIMFQEMYDIPIHQIVILIGCEDGVSQCFVENPLDYIRGLKRVIDSFRTQENNNLLTEITNEYASRNF